MRTVSALFDTYDEVAAAVDDLSDMGVRSSDIAVVSQGPSPLAKIMEGASLGAAIGGVGGLLAGFGMFILPGLEPVLGIDWLIPLLIGAAGGGLAGGVIGSLTRAGIGKGDALVPVGVPRGGTLLIARVHDDEAGEARAILLKCGAIDTNSKRSEYAADGWDGFVAKDIWDEDIGSEDERLHENRAERAKSARRHVA
jgi:hypothetical protein